MNRNELINALETDAIQIDEDTSSTNVEKPVNGEAMQIAVAKIREKRTKSGKVYGVKSEDEKANKRLTVQMQSFVNCLMQGMTPVQAYRNSYNTKTENHGTVLASANKLMKDPRISALLQGLEESVREKVIEDAVKTRRFVMERLHDKAKNASTDSVELKALELMGRAVGMFTDKVEGKIEEISTERLKAELKDHLKLLDNVTSISKRSA